MSLPQSHQGGGTLDLLDAWHRGDAAALDALVRMHVPWLRAYASRRLTRALRRFETSEDVVQSVLHDLLRFGAKFRPANEMQFRGLVARSVLNHLRSLHDYATAEKRAAHREEAVGSSAISYVGFLGKSAEQPERQAVVNEERARISLALQLIDPEDRRVIYLREWEGFEFEEVGAQLGISADAARMRFDRALIRLGHQVRRLRQGALDDLVAELDDEGPTR